MCPRDLKRDDEEYIATITGNFYKMGNEVILNEFARHSVAVVDIVPPDEENHFDDTESSNQTRSNQ